MLLIIILRRILLRKNRKIEWRQITRPKAKRRKSTMTKSKKAKLFIFLKFFFPFHYFYSLLLLLSYNIFYRNIFIIFFVLYFSLAIFFHFTLCHISEAIFPLSISFSYFFFLAVFVSSFRFPAYYLISVFSLQLFIIIFT